MAQWASSYGDNRFALLGENLFPKTKKKKRDTDHHINIFPELEKVNVQSPKFVVVTSESIDKPLSKYSCFAIYRSLQLISKEIISISELRDGNLLLLVTNGNIAKKFLNTKELTGLCKIKCTLHEKLNITKGTIYAPYLNQIPETEIIAELKTQGVVGVYKFTKAIEGKKVPNGVILLDFDSYSLPTKIDICWHSVKIKEYIPSPMRCRNCQLLGHTQKYCTNPATCVGCNLPPHSPEQCTRIYCANCAEPHPADHKECKKFTQQKQILTIKTQKKCSIREANKIYQQQQPISPNSNSLASIVKQNNIQKINVETEQTVIPKTKQLATPSTNPTFQNKDTYAKVLNDSIEKSNNQQTNSPIPTFATFCPKDVSTSTAKKPQYKDYTSNMNLESTVPSTNDNPFQNYNQPNSSLLSQTGSLINKAILTINESSSDLEQ